MSFKLRTNCLIIVLACICTSATPARAQQANTRSASGAVMIGARPVAGGADSSGAYRPAQFPVGGSVGERYNFLLPYIVNAARKNGVDPYLLTAVCDIETRFQPGVTSPKGAMGLTQLMPGTAARFGVSNAYDFVQALDGGAKYLRYLTELFGGNLDLILAGYNSGEGSVIKYGRRVPPFGETQGYVARGRVTYLRYLQSQFGDLGLERKAVDNVRATAYVQSRPSVSADEPNQDETTPETRSLVFGETAQKTTDEGKEKNQPAAGPSRVTRSIRFQ